jgi:hypothetical protein
MGVLVSPALLFVHQTAGLSDAFTQIKTYAEQEGARGRIFHPRVFEIGWNAPFIAINTAPGKDLAWKDISLLPGYVTKRNAGAWLYCLAIGLPLIALLLVALRKENCERPTIARVVCFTTLAELVALFILRDPVTARIGGVMPLIVVGGGYLVGEWRYYRRRWDVPPTPSAFASPGRRLTRGLITSAGVLVFLMALIGVGTLVEVPSKANLHISERLTQFSTVPPSLELWPTPSLLPLAKYFRACTEPHDRIFVGSFMGELYYFTGRGFAGGLPVVFGEHWSALSYQRRSLRLLEQQSVPIIVTSRTEDLTQYGFLWNFISKHYERVPHSDDVPQMQIWMRRDLPVVRRYGESGLPCYAG